MSSFVYPPSEILEGVYVGDALTARDAEFFLRNKIVRVVNCTTHIPNYYQNKIPYYRIPVGDSSSDEHNAIMTHHLVPAIQFVLSVLPNKDRGVLIHCHAGVSRSCTFAAALVRFCCLPSIKHSLDYVMYRRPVAFAQGMYLNFKKALYSVFGI